MAEVFLYPPCARGFSTAPRFGFPAKFVSPGPMSGMQGLPMANGSSTIVHRKVPKVESFGSTYPRFRSDGVLAALQRMPDAGNPGPTSYTIMSQFGDPNAGYKSSRRLRRPATISMGSTRSEAHKLPNLGLSRQNRSPSHASLAGPMIGRVVEPGHSFGARLSRSSVSRGALVVEPGLHRSQLASRQQL